MMAQSIAVRFNLFPRSEFFGPAHESSPINGGWSGIQVPLHFPSKAVPECACQGAFFYKKRKCKRLHFSK
jgi:hypothetical protein